MGFSVSGAAAIIFVSLFIAFGMLFTSVSNGFDRVTEAQDLRTDSALEVSNTEIDIVSAEYNTDSDELTVEAVNAGAAELELSETDFLVDGQFEQSWEDEATVEGSSETDLWLSGEQLEITLPIEDDSPARVSVVTSSGVSVTSDVSEVSAE